MKKNSKFDKIFWVGLIPISIIVIIFMLIVIAFFYTSLKKKDQIPFAETTKSEHVCPKAEKVYIHDTVIVRVPTSCNKQHVQDEVQTPDQQAINDTNGSEIKKP